MTDTAEILPPSQEIARIDDKVDPARIRAITVGRSGAITFADYGQVIEFSKGMARTDWAIPVHLRNREFGCLAICTRAGWWGQDPFFVAEHSYLVKDKSGNLKLAYDSAVFQAIVNSRAPIKHRLRHRFEGDGNDMTCTVWTTFIGENVPSEWTSPTLKERMTKQAANSPLWQSKPRVQLAYDTIRDWARLYCQDILGGIYDKDELAEGDEIVTDVSPASPNLMERLPGRQIGAAGFQPDVVDTGLAEKAAKEAKERQELKAEWQAGWRAASRAGLARASQAKAKAVQEVSEADPIQTATEPEQAPPAPPVQPQTPEQYMSYAAKWIEKGSSADDLEARWDGEIDMRSSLKVPLAARKRLEGMMKEQIAELRKRK